VNGSKLREGLLGAEPPSAELRQKHRDRLLALTERRITPAQRVGHVLGLVLALGAAARFVQLFLQHSAGDRPVALAGIAVGLAFCLGWSAFSIALLRRGTEDLRLHGALRTQLVGLFTLALAGLMLWAGIESPDPARGNRLILFGLVFWTTLGLPFFIAQVVRQNEFRVRLDVLRLELALAEREGVHS
jgi:hypothetical protein